MAPMDLTHRFSVPAPVRKVWNVFNHVERLAPCFPGATITGVDGDEFTGKLKIKLGPTALVYNGSGRYLERNKTERRVLIEANGNDRRRNGTAAVTVTASFTANGNHTDVEVLTSLAITGKPAQFGDEVISDVSHRLLDQFVACISGRLAEDLGDVQAASVESGVAAGAARIDASLQGPGADVFAGSDEAVVAGGFDQADTEQTIELEAVPAEYGAATGPTAEPSAPGPVAAGAGAAGELNPPGPVAAGVAPQPETAADSSAAPGASERPQFTAPPGRGTESTLDVLRTVLPVLVKRYGPALAVCALLLFIVIKIVRRKS
jgi:carbon monoxide dehydrogenase subunit G